MDLIIMVLVGCWGVTVFLIAMFDIEEAARKIIERNKPRGRWVYVAVKWDWVWKEYSDG